MSNRFYTDGPVFRDNGLSAKGRENYDAIDWSKKPDSVEPMINIVRSAPMLDGVCLISIERDMQKSKFDACHDDSHSCKELAQTAHDLLGVYILGPEKSFAWDRWGIVEKHRDNPVKMLTIIGALCAAEIDRIHRASV